jgi:hypothetical protein
MGLLKALDLDLEKTLKQSREEWEKKMGIPSISSGHSHDNLAASNGSTAWSRGLDLVKACD